MEASYGNAAASYGDATVVYENAAVVYEKGNSALAGAAYYIYGLYSTDLYTLQLFFRCNFQRDFIRL